ncbi:MAG TPA: hypothetical protein DD856_08060 [Sulfobacillus sp.]|nr:hypothetical protein [Sulfobacillus sp.]
MVVAKSSLKPSDFIDVERATHLVCRRFLVYGGLGGISVVAGSYYGHHVLGSVDQSATNDNNAGAGKFCVVGALDLER